MSKAIEQRRGLSLAGLGRAGRFAWEAIWLPFWLGSTMPPPTLSGKGDPRPVAGERTPRILQELDTLRDSIWRQRRSILVFRSAWLALAALDAWLLLRVVAHRPAAFAPFLILALVLLAGGALLIATARPSRGQLARTLDRSFDLRERVATAYETAQGDRRIAGVRALQVLEATRVAKQVGTAGAFRQRRPTREIAPTVALAVLGAVLLVFLLLRGGPGGLGNGNGAGQGAGQNGNGAGNTGQTNQGNQGSQAGANQGNQGNQGSQGGQSSGQPSGSPSGAGQQDLNAVANALQNHGSTQQAANQIRNGDYAGAAQSLRETGKQASQMTPQERQALAQDLQNAAGQVSDPQLKQDLNQAASALQQPNAAGAQQAIDNLANDIQGAGQGQNQGNQGAGNQAGPSGQPSGAPGTSGSGGGSGVGGSSPQLPSTQRSQPSAGPATDPLGANGQPVQLPKGNQSGPTINTPNQSGRGNGTTDPGAAAASGGQLQQGSVGDAGVDPNSVPFEQRGAVQQYFTPLPSDDNGR